MPLAAALLAGTWSWTTGGIALACAAAAGAVACRRALRTRAIEDARRAAWTEATLRDRAALRRLLRPVAVVGLLGAGIGLLWATDATGRAGAFAFAVGIAVAFTGLAVAAALERATRYRLPAPAPGSETAAADVASDGARSAVLLVSGLQALASALVAAVLGGPAAAWGLASGALVVAWLAQAAGAPSPAAARLAGLMSVQAFALAAVANFASAELEAMARLLVALGAALPWLVRTRGADGLEFGAGRRRVVPLLVLLLGGALFVQFLPRGVPAAGGWAALESQLAGLLLVAFAARAGLWSTRPAPPATGSALAPLLPLLGLAAVLVFTSAVAGAAGLALATAAAAALLPVETLDGFAADVAAPPTWSSASGDSAPGDGARDASCAVVLLAGWAALRGAPGEALDLRDPATAGAVTVGVLVALLAAALWRRGEGAGSSCSTDAPPRAMIGAAVLAAAVPWCVARLDAAAGGGIAAGVLLGGGTAALLAPLAAAAPLERIVQLTFVVLAFAPR